MFLREVPEMRQNIIMLLLCLLFVVSLNAYADTVYLKKGSQYQGTVIRQDDEKVTLRIGEGEDGVEITLFNDEILRIDKAEVSSFITLPFGSDQQIDIPRPIFQQVPVVTEQVKVQREQKSKTEQSMVEDAQPEPSEDIDALPEELDQEEAVSDKFQKVELIIEDILESDDNLPPIPNVDAEESREFVESYLRGSHITEELSQLLDEEEKEYFSTINTMVQGVTAKMADLISNPKVTPQDQEELSSKLKDMPEEMDDIIAQFEKIDVPELFVNFHNKYAENLSLMKDVFVEIAKGDVQGSQRMTYKVMNTSRQLQEELLNILTIKRAEQSSTVDDAN